MAKSFIYDSIGLSESAVKAGTYSATTFTPAEAQITDEHRVIDQSIGSVITSFDDGDAIRFDLGSSQTANVLAVNFNGAEADQFKIHTGASATAMGSAILDDDFDVDSDGGWDVFTVSGSGRYWFLTCPDDTFLNMTEVIIGTKYDFDANPDINNEFGEEFNTDINISYGGDEYACKRHEPKTTWSWNWPNISSSMKTSLEGVRDSVQDYKKFLYYDETSYHYVRMTEPMDFTEVAYQRYSTNIKLREQLA